MLKSEHLWWYYIKNTPVNVRVMNENNNVIDGNDISLNGSNDYTYGQTNAIY